MKKNKLYVVKDFQTDSIWAIFSSFEKANSFVHRWVDMGDDNLYIDEDHVLDPDFLSFPDKSHFAVYLKMDGEIFETEILADLNLDQEAQNETVCTFMDVRIRMHFFAKNEEEAIRKAHERREKMIKSGEWASLFQELSQ
jgi:hypothetical protein